MSWFDEQQQPGGAVAPIEAGYAPERFKGSPTGSGMSIDEIVAASEARRRSPDYRQAFAGDGSEPTRGIPSMAERTGGAGTQAYSDQALQEILNRYPPTNEGMRAAMAEVDRTFGAGTVKLLDHPQRLDKLVLPDGRTIDTIVGAGGTNPSWGWMVEGAHGATSGAVGGAMAGAMAPGSFGSLLARPMDGRPLTDDPGFQFRLQEGQKAIERSAASKGTLLTGKTLKDLTRWGQDYASNEYQNAWNRDYTHQNSVFDRLYRTSALGLQGTTHAQQLASGYANNISNGQIGIGNVQAGATQANANANANTIGTIGNMVGQWGTDYYNRRANGGDYLDYGRGLY